MANIQPLVQIGVNYICFIMASQGVNWSFDNKTQYSDFLSDEHKNVLLNNKSALSFRDGNHGDLAISFFLFPAYLNLQTQEEIKGYYDMLSMCVASGDWSGMEEQYKADLQHIREFYTYCLSKYGDNRPGKEYTEKVKALSAVFCDNFERYHNTIWTQDKKYLDSIAKLIPDLWGGEDIISQWEKYTGLKFSAPSYRILLVSAMQHGPCANSLAFDTNTFPAGDDDKMMYYYKHFISHEVGTHLLVPFTINKVRNQKWQYLAYIAMENLAQYVNNQIFAFTDYNQSNEGYYHHNYFQKIYTELNRQYPKAPVLKLFKLAVKQAKRDKLKQDSN